MYFHVFFVSLGGSWRKIVELMDDENWTVPQKEIEPAYLSLHDDHGCKLVTTFLEKTYTLISGWGTVPAKNKNCPIPSHGAGEGKRDRVNVGTRLYTTDTGRTIVYTPAGSLDDLGDISCDSTCIFCVVSTMFTEVFWCFFFGWILWIL